MEKPIFSPSVMSADLLRLGDCLREAAPVSDMLHFDIMDGHFAPNLTLAPDTVRAVRPMTEAPLDAHLMVTDPARFVEDVINAGADYVTLHAETISGNAFRLINLIRSRGRKVGIALNPATPLEAARYYLADADLLLLMTVDVGYGGQKFIPAMLAKIGEAVRYREETGAHYIIQTDGGVNEDTCRGILAAGADSLILGRGLFRRDMPLRESVGRWLAIKNELAAAKPALISE